MRVVHVINDLSGGGAERLLLEQCRRAADDIEPRVVTISEGGTLHRAFEAAGVPVWCAGRTRGRLGVRATRRLVGQLRGADVVHTHLWAGDQWGRAAARMAGVPVVVSTEHNVPDLVPAWKRAAKVQSSVLADRVIAVSEAVAAAWRAEGLAAHRLVVVPNGIDLERFSSPHEGGDGLLFIGRLVEQKGVDVLMDAMRRLPDQRLTVVGSGSERGRAPETVRFVGEVDDVAPYLKRADALLIPSRWEGFGLVAAEAMAAGVPVVASRVPALVEVLGGAAVWVRPGDAPDLVRGVRALQRESQLRDAIVSIGRRRASLFSLEGTITSIEALYRDLRGV